MPSSTSVRTNATLVFTVLMLSSIGCSKQVTQSRRSITGTKAERIAAVEKLLKKSRQSDELPGPILDAQLEEIPIGDNNLGPADFQTFVWIKVEPEDVTAWENALTPRDQPIDPIAARPPKWWKDDIDRDAVTFSPKPLFGRSNGWVLIQEDGQIFAFTFSM